MNNPNIGQICKSLKEGKTVLYPTDTVWGLGCDATNEEAVAKIIKLKERGNNKSMIVLVSSEGMLSRYVKVVPDVAWELIESSNKPITIVFSDGINLASNALASDGSIGIRITQDSFCKHLISQFNRPIISTSANISNMPTPANFDNIADAIKDNVDLIVTNNVHILDNEPSSVIKLENNGKVKILRK